MKLKYFVFFLFLFPIVVCAQIQKPAKWSYTIKQKDIKVGDVIDLQFNAKIDDGWYLYSSDFDPELGPTVTTINLDKSADLKKIGGLVPVNPKKKYDEIFEGNVTYFTKSAVFIQKIKVLSEKFSVSGKIDGQTCTEKDGVCVPLKENFTFDIVAKKSSIADSASIVVSAVDKNKDTNNAIVASDLKPVKNIEKTQNIKEAPEKQDTTSLWSFLLLAFGAGLASIFMPCIFPIMPMTVSFFIKQEGGKAKAVLYGLSIMFIFGLMGLVTMAFGAPFLNFLSTHWLPNTIFFVIFIAFGFSLLGAFEIVLPHNAVNKIDRMSDRGGLIGIFFMALTLVVVSFSCTVPFIGSLLITAAQGEVTRPIFGMLAFGFPFALVFSSLAMFPKLLDKLPKSGGWLNELKAVFGFAEFALALKFLSQIDLAYHFNLLDRNIFLVIWILISAIIAIYIFGFIRLKKDNKVEKIGGLRLFFGTFFIISTLYMIPGVTGKSLSLLSGILPPISNKNSTKVESDLPSKKMKPLVHDLAGFHDFDDAAIYAKEINKPILIDFTGYACANCRKMEENVWGKPDVLSRLKNDFVIASLYVDDKEELPKEKHYKSTYDDEIKTTVGDKNMDLEITKYNNNAQPFYVIVTPTGETISGPIAYSSKEDFLKFLEAGLKK
jgi:thiol:disulfide interchange protein